MINWEANKKDMDTIHQIAIRYISYAPLRGVPKQYQRPLMDIEMDITVTHLNGNQLDLVRLLNAGDMDFYHDMIGIQKNLNRSTGQLNNCFVPRYTEHQ